ncbi:MULTISPECIES: Gp19/Gp15/Gp42 family protein [Actinomycetes]|uniref:Gp19/Gp15/Gp42 family protein n=1 Tax=Micromonospora sp. NPDC005367 TaxID=3155590 RepID=UPI0033A7E747
MADFATFDDLAAYWRPLSSEEEDKATILLGYAATLIRAEVPDIDQRLSDGADPGLPKLVSLRVVKRAMVNSDVEGISQHSDFAGPYQSQNTYSNPMGELYLTAADTRMLRPGGTGVKAFSISTTPADAGTGLPYWDSEATG